MTNQYANPHLKMYILVRKRAPVGVAAVNAAHVAVMAFDRFKNDKDMKKWFNPGPFYKVLVAVTDKEWKAAKRVRDHVLIREDMWGNREVAMAFKPRLNWPKAFKEFPFFPAKKKRKTPKYTRERQHMEIEWPRKHVGGDLRYITDPERTSHYADGM